MSREVLFREAVLGFMSGGKVEPDFGFSVKMPEESKGLNEVKLGRFCGGKDISECKKYFGEGLALVCRTCPQ